MATAAFEGLLGAAGREAARLTDAIRAAIGISGVMSSRAHVWRMGRTTLELGPIEEEEAREELERSGIALEPREGAVVKGIAANMRLLEREMMAYHEARRGESKFV